MKTAAIIAEFNPYHYGHERLTIETRALGADLIVAFMSGDFVQRGDPAVCDKYLRAEAAVKRGVDVVFELPTVYATAAAPDFAFGGVALAHKTGCIDSLVFGSECGDIDLLQRAAELISDETTEFKEILNLELRNGLSYPAALSKAACELDPELGALLRKPNNTLAIEYIKALKKLNSNITPFTIPRYLTDHAANEMKKDPENGLFYASAMLIRKTLSNGLDDEVLSTFLPPSTWEIVVENSGKCLPISSDDFSMPLQLILDRLSDNDISLLPGTRDSKAKLLKYRNEQNTFSSLKDKIKDKSLTEASAGRLLIHALLDIKDSDIDRTTGPSYLRLLAMNKNASPLLKAIKQNASIPIITKAADFDIDSCPMLQKDISASNLYERVVSNKFGKKYVNDIAHSPVIV